MSVRSATRATGPTVGLLAGTAAAGVAGLAAVVARDPHVPNSWGVCPLLATTGVFCPGCGGLRAVADLARGDVTAALSSNALAVVLLAVAALAWLLAAQGLALRRAVPWERWVTGRVAAVVITALAAFSVLRNTPLAGGLTP